MRISLQSALLGFLILMLAACGGSSSSGPTAIPTTATIFYSHALAFRNNTTLSWGYNGFGQLGTGNLVNSSVPVPVPGVSGAQKVAVGADHSVALLGVFGNATTVSTWGSNQFGQLGVETTTITKGNLTSSFSSSPVKVSIPAVSAANSVKTVAAGGNHTMALLQDGTIWTWGSNTFGQLGNPATFTTISPAPVQVQLDPIGGLPLGRIQEIAAAGSHSLALDLDGNVWAWGNNATGQLGADIFANTNTSATYVPRKVAGLPRIKHITAAGSFNLAIADDGTGNVWAWGYNGFGQLGNNTLSESNANISFTPVRVVTAADGTLLSNIVAVAAGLDHSLALDANGNVWAWGFNSQGQLGINSKADSLVAVKVKGPDGASDLTGATFIFAVGNYSQAKIGNVLYAWGENSFGQLGNGLTTSFLFPQKVSGF